MKALIAEDPNWFVEQIKKVRAFSVLSDKELMYVVSQIRSFYFKDDACESGGSCEFIFYSS